MVTSAPSGEGWRSANAGLGGTRGAAGSEVKIKVSVPLFFHMQCEAPLLGRRLDGLPNLRECEEIFTFYVRFIPGSTVILWRQHSDSRVGQLVLEAHSTSSTISRIPGMQPRTSAPVQLQNPGEM